METSIHSQWFGYLFVLSVLTISNEGAYLTLSQSYVRHSNIVFFAVSIRERVSFSLLMLSAKQETTSTILNVKV